MNQEMNERSDKDSNIDNETSREEISEKIVEVDASFEEEPVSENNEDVQTKPRMSKKKKIVIISVSAFLGLLLLIGGVGVYLFFHYYNQLDIQGREDIDADERVIKLFDAESGERYTFEIDLLQLPDADVSLVDNWYVTNKELVLSVGKDPAEMTETEKEALLLKILAELRRLSAPDVKVTEVKVYNTKDGKEYTVTIERDLISEGTDYTAILEFIDSESEELIRISFDGDPASMKDEEKTALFAKIAAEIRNMQKVRYPVLLKDAETGEQITFMIYEEELSEEQAKLIRGRQPGDHPRCTIK